MENFRSRWLRGYLLGHAVTLGAKEALDDPEHYLIYRLLWEKAQAQGANNGYAHWGVNANRGVVDGLPILLPMACYIFWKS